MREKQPGWDFCQRFMEKRHLLKNGYGINGKHVYSFNLEDINRARDAWQQYRAEHPNAVYANGAFPVLEPSFEWMQNDSAHAWEERGNERGDDRRPPLLLAILDGWGISAPSATNAIYRAKTETMDKLSVRYPHTTLCAHGEAVGLPAGQMGNSEVGHANIGAGRVVYQDFSRINNAVRDGSFYKNFTFCEAMRRGKTVHLMGLLSDGGVHSHTSHLYALLEMCRRQNKRVRIHCFLDGRDVQPGTGEEYLAALQEKLDELGGDMKISTVCGRYFAMDRDKRWERLGQAYRFLTGQRCLQEHFAVDTDQNGEYPPWHPQLVKPREYLEKVAREDNETDEFVFPAKCTEDYITSEDSVIFWNFRPDRARELTAALTEDGFDGFKREQVIKPYFVCMTQYDESFLNVQVAFPPEHMKNILGEVLAKNGRAQLRIAETEKYAHVTFFFDGGREEPFEDEERKLVPSPKVATYDLMPSMSAAEVTKYTKWALLSGAFDVIILNFANCDMVGHTGNLHAAVQAAEFVDARLGELTELVTKLGGVSVITADHGNADKMADGDGFPFTAHTCAPVPFIITKPGLRLREGGALCDVAPTVLDLLGIEKPTEMTGSSLIEGKIENETIEGDVSI